MGAPRKPQARLYPTRVIAWPRTESIILRQVDVWALGISAIEMAEIKPPRWAVHPMRVIFMISREPPPRLADDTRWSLTLQNFVATCLQKVR